MARKGAQGETVGAEGERVIVNENGVVCGGISTREDSASIWRLVIVVRGE